LGVPLPESTQWELMAPLAAQAQPIFAELVAQAANAPLLHRDDTTMRILDLRRPDRATADPLALLPPTHRTGTFTMNILAEVGPHPVALYFTGWRHAGENLADVLRQRAKDLAPPIQRVRKGSTVEPNVGVPAEGGGNGRRAISDRAPGARSQAAD